MPWRERFPGDAPGTFSAHGPVASWSSRSGSGTASARVGYLWSGYDGSAYTPLDVSEGNYTVSGGSITVPLGTLDKMSAYQLIVTPATTATITAPAAPGTQKYEAESAALTDASVFTQGNISNYNGNATSGGEDVGGIDANDSRVVFTVNAPTSGQYLLQVYYGNQTQTIAQQIMKVGSGSWSYVNYPPTASWLIRSHQDMYVNLTAGTHTITFGKYDSSFGTAAGQVTMDDIQLTYAPSAIAGVTGPATAYAATAATSACTTGCLAPQSVALGTSGAVSFAVDAASDGSYTLATTGASGSGTLSVDGVTVPAGTVYLHAGINPVTYSGSGSLGGIKITSTTGAATTYAASSSANTLGGTAEVESDSCAYNGQYVGWIGNGSANTITFNGVTAAAAGAYRVMVSYAEADGETNQTYSTNENDRTFTVTTSAGSSVTTGAKNTYSWDQYDTVEVTVQLNAGSNTITIGNASAYAPNIDKIIVAPASGS